LQHGQYLINKQRKKKGQNYEANSALSFLGDIFFFFFGFIGQE